MSVRRLHPQTNSLYFITFTCVKHIPLFAETELYPFIGDQFKLLQKEGYSVSGFVIMPNHLHFLFYVPIDKNLNQRIGTMKRFLSYEIVKRLEKTKSYKRLDFLSKQVNQTDKARNKKHAVFEPSFDARVCLSRDMADQKLKYMHYNPCSGKWNLAKEYTDYTWSSARYYEYDDKQDFDFLVRYEDYV